MRTALFLTSALALAAALAPTSPAQADDRFVVRRPLGGDTTGQIVLRQPDLRLDPTDPNSPTLDLSGPISVSVGFGDDPGAGVTWVSAPAADLNTPDGPGFAHVQRFASRLDFAGSLEVDEDGDGSPDGLIPDRYPVSVRALAADGSEVGAPFELELGVASELPEGSVTVEVSPPWDPTLISQLVARVGIVAAGGARGRVVAQVSDGSGLVDSLQIEFTEASTGPAPLSPMTALSRKAGTLRIGASEADWDQLAALSPSNQGEFTVTWMLQDAAGGALFGVDTLQVDTRDVVLRALTAVEEPGRDARVRTRVAGADGLDLDGGQHLLLSRPTLDDGGCPEGTVALQGRCYLDPGGDVAETGTQCPVGTHLCSCGQCVGNYEPPRRRTKGGFVVDISGIEPIAPQGTFPAVLTVDVRSESGELLRTASCDVPDGSAPCDLMSGDGAETSDTLVTRSGWYEGAVLTTDTAPGETASVTLVPLDPNVPVVSMTQESSTFIAASTTRMPGNTSDIGGEWTYEVEVLDPSGAWVWGVASGPFSIPAGGGEFIEKGVVVTEAQ